MAESRTREDRGSIYLDRELLRMGKFLADQSDRTLTDFIEEELRKAIIPKYRKALDRERAELGESGA